MERYLNRGGNSNVESYKIGADFIEVKFMNSTPIYVYNYGIPSEHEVEYMKKLAQDGVGLNSYISKYIKKRYAYKY